MIVYRLMEVTNGLEMPQDFILTSIALRPDKDRETMNDTYLVSVDLGYERSRVGSRYVDLYESADYQRCARAYEIARRMMMRPYEEFYKPDGTLSDASIHIVTDDKTLQEEIDRRLDGTQTKGDANGS